MSFDNLSDLGECGHFGKSGATITGYYNQLSKERNSLTLKIRRESFNTMNTLLKRDLSVPKPKILNTDQDLALMQPDYAIEALQSDNENQICTFLNNFILYAQSNVKNVSKIVSNENVIINFCNLFNSEFNVTTTLSLYQVTSIFFQQSKLNKVLVDSDVIPNMSSVLIADESELTIPQIALIGSIAASSVYARDAIFCFGIHTALIDKIQNTSNDEVKEAAGKCLCIIFGGSHPLSTDIIHDCLQSFVHLLENAQPMLIKSIFTIFIDMTNKVTETVYAIYELGLFPLVVQSIQVPELRAVSLALCGNLTVSQPVQARKFLSLGLTDILFSLLNEEEDAPYALWILSNLLDSIPNQILPILTMEMILQVVQMTDNSSSEFKQEVTYFVCTVVIVAGTDVDLLFMRQIIIDLMVEMLGCGITNVVGRCIEALQRIALAAQSTGNSEQFATLIQTSDFSDRVEDLQDDVDSNIIDKITSLQQMIDEMSS